VDTDERGAEWLSVTQAAEWVGRSAKTIRRKIAASKLIARREGDGERAAWSIRADSLAKLYPHAATPAAKAVPEVGIEVLERYQDRERGYLERIATLEGRSARADAIAETMRERVRDQRDRADENAAKVRELEAELHELRNRRWWQRRRFRKKER